MWQKYPICNGNGKIEEHNLCPNLTSIIAPNIIICPTCNGQRIISELTELPPSLVKDINSKQTTENLCSIKSQNPEDIKRYNYIKEKLNTTGKASITQYEFDFLQEFEKKS